MAKIEVDFPREWDANVVYPDGKMEGKQVVIEPSFADRVMSSPCLFLTVRGDGGMERRMVVVLNGNTGWAEIRKVQHQGTCQFDMPKAEYERKNSDEDSSEPSEQETTQ